MLKRFRQWLPTTKLKHWYVYGLITFIVTVSLLASTIILYSHEGNQVARQRIYESSLWNALQFQLQSYRFLNYLVQLDESDLPLNGAAFDQYDLLMSRVDLLRNGEVGYLIRGLTGGRTVRLLNIITGELELISLNLTKIEEGDLTYLKAMTTRLQRLDQQINEFSVLVSKDTNKYIVRQRHALAANLEQLRILMLCFLASLVALGTCIAKGFSVFKANQRSTQQLLDDIHSIHEDKLKMLTLVGQEARPQIQALLGTPCINSASSSNIKESANELLHTMNMFTDLALLDAQKLYLSPSTESLHKHVEALIDIFSPKLQRKGLTLISYIDPSLPERIHIDFKRVKEILVELIQNAIKHTSEGSISLHIRPSSLAPTAQTNKLENRQMAMLQIAIKDTGFGLEKSLQNSLRSAPLNETRPQTFVKNDITSALGLSLCYRLTHLMQGEIHFSSEAEVGTEFWVDLPYEGYQGNKGTTQPVEFTDPKRALIFTQDTHLNNFLGLLLADLNIELMSYSEGPYYSDEDLNLVFIMDDSLISQEVEANILQWQENGTQVLYDQKIDALTQHKAYANHAISLTFPLTQSRLIQRLTQGFEQDNNGLPNSNT